MSEENILIKKLEEFIRKYYKNKLIKGALISFGVLLSLYLAEIILEYFNYFPSATRGTLLILYIAIASGMLFAWVIRPAMKLLKIGKIISYEQAAVIIGKHFSQIQDKLLNTLNLIEEKNKEDRDKDLVLASIDQRIRSMKIISFQSSDYSRKSISKFTI